MTPTDEEGKARTQEQMQELVQAAHQAHTRKALDNIKVTNLGPEGNSLYGYVSLLLAWGSAGQKQSSLDKTMCLLGPCLCNTKLVLSPMHCLNQQLPVTMEAFCVQKSEEAR